MPKRKDKKQEQEQQVKTPEFQKALPPAPKMVEVIMNSMKVIRH